MVTPAPLDDIVSNFQADNDDPSLVVAAAARVGPAGAAARAPSANPPKVQPMESTWVQLLCI